MSRKLKQLDKTKSLLSQALESVLSSMPNNQKIIEATRDIRKAIRKIDEVSQEQMQKIKTSESQFQNWWGNVQSGVPLGAMSLEACQKSLNQLNGMIYKEQSKIDEIETKSSKIKENSKDQLFQD